MARTLQFTPSARLQRFLGTELIADPNVAIIEFVKNSYDAGASHVVVQFDLSREPTRLLIADNGVGMNLDSFEENWMHPGFSQKADDAPKPAKRSVTAAGRRRDARVPVGEKGIGRLAAGRLGDRLEVFTRERRGDDWLHVDFVWSKFDDMTLALDKVKIPFDFVTVPPVTPPDAGTMIVIHDLTQQWDQRVRGRAVRGRRTTRLGRLKQDLQYLLRPLTPVENSFQITLASDVVFDREDIGVITPRVAVEDAHYSYSFKFTADSAGRPTIERTLTRNAEASALVGRVRKERLPRATVTASVAKKEGRPVNLLSGPFEGTFLYNPPSSARRAREIEKSPVGVLLYRDGLMVEPYGMDDDDWVGVRARKAQRHGHAAITPDTFSGFVLIGRRRNRQLRDMSNRLGLLETPESENFVEHVRAEFMHFESLLEAEVVEPRVEESRTERAQVEAERAQRLSALRLRGLAHSLRQPLQGLGYELVTLRILEERPDIPPDAREVLRGVREAVESHISRAELFVRRFLDAKTPEFATVPLRGLVQDAVDQLEPVARSGGVSLVVSQKLPSTDVLVPPDIVIQAICNLLHNAIEADRPDALQPVVTIGGEMLDGDVLLIVSDNGLGIPDYIAGTALRDVRSTKGRPEVGLADAELALAAANGSLRLVRTGPAGTEFEVRLPTRVGGLKR